MAIDRTLLKGTMPILVLGVLATGEQYGYQMIRSLADSSGGLLTFKEGALYPVLHNLERDGLISSTWEGPEGGRRRRIYAITEPGREALAGRVDEWRMVTQAVDAVIGGPNSGRPGAAHVRAAGEPRPESAPKPRGVSAQDGVQREGSDQAEPQPAYAASRSLRQQRPKGRVQQRKWS